MAPVVLNGCVMVIVFEVPLVAGRTVTVGVPRLKPDPGVPVRETVGVPVIVALPPRVTVCVIVMVPVVAPEVVSVIPVAVAVFAVPEVVVIVLVCVPPSEEVTEFICEAPVTRTVDVIAPVESEPCCKFELWFTVKDTLMVPKLAELTAESVANVITVCIIQS